MLRSNGEESFNNLVKVLTKYKPDDELLSGITFSIHANNIKRVHEQGRSYTGREIGEYSISPIYVNPTKSPVKFPPKGKNGRAAFNSGRRKRTRYFEGGYKGFKQHIGRLRETKSVNLRLFGDLQRGFVPEKRGERWLIGIIGKEVKKYNSLVRRYGLFYGVSEEDNKLVNNILKKRLQQIK